jgi:uncharacterized membrane protein YphA (DoxX/SURF4 family)
MQLGLALPRAIVGGLFIGHGLQTLTGWFGGYGLEGTGKGFEAMGLRPGRVHAAAAGASETAGGALIATGLLTPVAASLLSGTMVTAIRKVHAPTARGRATAATSTTWCSSRWSSRSRTWAPASGRSMRHSAFVAPGHAGRWRSWPPVRSAQARWWRWPTGSRHRSSLHPATPLTPKGPKRRTTALRRACRATTLTPKARNECATSASFSVLSRWRCPRGFHGPASK